MLTLTVLMLSAILTQSYHCLPKLVPSKSLRLVPNQSKSSLAMSQDEDSPRDCRKIIGKDNLGEPIYEGDSIDGGNTINILGQNVALDPITGSLIVFLVIAIQFFGTGFFFND